MIKKRQTIKRQAILWRRNKVEDLLIKGYTQTRIANELQIVESTISTDMKFLRQRAKESMKEHLEERLPMEFNTCMKGLNEVLRISFEIANGYNANANGNEDNGRILTTEENRTRLQALALVNDCYKYKMELMTNGAVVSDALRYVERKHNELEKIDKDNDIQRISTVT